MTVTQTTRMQQTRWDDAADPFTRAQLDDDHASIEALAAGFLDGDYGDLPAASAALDRFFFMAADARALFRCDGTTWTPVGEIASMTTAQRDALVAGGKWAGRVIYNTTTARLEKYIGGSWSSVQGSGVLAYTQYTGGAGNYSIASTTLTAVDTTNLRATFTAPDTGAVKVTVEAAMDTATAVAGYIHLGILDGATNRGEVAALYDTGAGGSGLQPQPSRTIRVTGLTPGNSYSFDLAWRCASASMTARLFKGPNFRPTIIVEAAL